MLAKILAAALAAGAMTAGPAHADAPVFDCGFSAPFTDNTPDDHTTYHGFVHGFIVGAPGEQVWIECYVSVDGVPATPIGPMETNSTVDVHPPTLVSYEVVVDQEVALCARWYAEQTSTSPQDTCFESLTIGTDTVFDLVDEILEDN